MFGRLFFVWVIIGFSCFITFAFGEALLPLDEVSVLREIGRTLKMDQKIDRYSCKVWRDTATSDDQHEFNVTCNCTFSDNTVCHVDRIILKGHDLKGTLPGELAKLPNLLQIDLTRNYLNGTIPREWGTMKLTNISLLGNRLSGSIPTELGNINTLEELVLDFNKFSGNLPPELGNLVSLERLLISSNYFNGTLPGTLAKLTNLTDVRINDNNFSGKIPNFIEKWTNLKRLEIQASGLEGPIPAGIFNLTALEDMRISDIKGTEWSLPRLINMTSMKTLILRSCNLVGNLSQFHWEDLEKMKKLKTLDLSFNKLNGEMRSPFKKPPNLNYMYLTWNLLTGRVPTWVKEITNMDLSYNKFTLENAPYCPLPNELGVDPCLENHHCLSPYSHYFHINCGGKEEQVNGTVYDGDLLEVGHSNFQSKNNWAISSTGHFMDNEKNILYFKENTPKSSTDNLKLYQNARLSPLSLTYVGFCLLNGNYTVNLYFAEIIFTNDESYKSLGRRIFDVYIQGKLVLQDFNIKDEVGKEVKRNFPANVSNHTLEIRFHWAGKGTTRIPSSGTYGPLISAISVYSDFDPLEKKTSTIVIIGIVALVLCFFFTILGILWWKGYLGQKHRRDQELRGLDLQTGSFTLRQIKAATNNFDAVNKIGEGGFGPVYKGHLSDGTIIAVKQLSSKSKQGNREFVNEIGMISALQHPNLVRLYGCCIEGNQLLLVYEYLENNSLARALFGPEESRLNLDWRTRHKICVGIARGLAYLHEESRLKIVHRDIKATNVLLDKEFNPKISDFGLAKLDDEDNTHISTRIAGTYGYMAPEYAMWGYLTDKADVYSFGVVALEIVSGRSNINHRPKADCVYLLDLALVLQEKGSLMELVDPRLEEYNKEEVMTMINVALQCTNASSTLRPIMSTVVSMLEGQNVVEEFVSDPGTSSDDLKFKAIRKHYQQSQNRSMDESQTHNMSMAGPSTGSSTSAHDLYPVNMDSQYLIQRE